MLGIIKALREAVRIRDVIMRTQAADAWDSGSSVVLMPAQAADARD